MAPRDGWLALQMAGPLCGTHQIPSNPQTIRIWTDIDTGKASATADVRSLPETIIEVEIGLLVDETNLPKGS